MPIDRFVDLQHVMVAPQLPTADVMTAVRLDPGVARMRLDRIRPELFDLVASRGFDRADSPNPVSPVAQPADTTLFASAAGDVSYYLPRYRLRTTAPGRYDVNVVADPRASGQWVVSLGLETFPAPELGDAARTAQVLPHQLNAAVHFHMPNSSVERRLPASELLSDARGPVVVLRLGLAERDELLGAFMAQSAGASLTLQRSFTVSVEIPAAAPPPPPPPHPPLPVPPIPRPPRPIPVHPHRPGGGLIHPQLMEAQPAAMRFASVAMTVDRSAMLRRRFEIDPSVIDAVVAEPVAPQPQFRTQSLNQALEIALWFDSGLHSYVYPNGSPSAGSVTSLQMHSVPYTAPGRSTRHHSYLQSSSNPTRFYFCPTRSGWPAQNTRPSSLRWPSWSTSRPMPRGPIPHHRVHHPQVGRGADRRRAASDRRQALAGRERGIEEQAADHRRAAG